MIKYNNYQKINKLAYQEKHIFFYIYASTLSLLSSKLIIPFL